MNTQQDHPTPRNQTAEEAARETANAVLRQSFAAISRLAPEREIGAAEAILIAAHANATQQAAILAELKRIAGR